MATLEKAQILVLHTGERIKVMFNPEEYTVNKDNNFASQSIPGLSSPLLQFVNGNLRTLEMELFFDTLEKHTDVRDETKKVANLLTIDPTLHAPPVLQVTWGSLTLTCVLARVSQKFILFFPDGKPARARLTVTFNEFIDPEHEAKDVSRQTADFSKVHVVTEGETLSGIAGKLYDDPQNWRPIARWNDIADPLSMFPGQQLLIPSLPFDDPETH
jgi:LysM repeat protein